MMTPLLKVAGVKYIFICVVICIAVVKYLQLLQHSEKLVLLSKAAPENILLDTELLETWLESFNAELTEQNHRLSLARFQYDTNVTEDTGQKLSEISVKAKAWLVNKVEQGKTFLVKLKMKLQDKAPDSPEKERLMLRALKMITAGSSMSRHESTNRKIIELDTELDRISATATVQNYTLKQLEGLMTRGGYEERLWSWLSWRDATGPKMRPLYHELVQNLRNVAEENGYNDMGEIWRQSELEEDADDLEAMADQLYTDIKPLYRELHTYVRRQLRQKYPDRIEDLRRFIPAHLLGNMWAQTWNVKGTTPYPGIPKHDITSRMKGKYTVVEMVKLAEEFYTSLGFDKMTPTFWEESMFTRPRDHRQVQCHASAYDMFAPGDFRLKMCSGVTSWDLCTLHHELGHIVYYMTYAHQQAIFRKGTSSAFHEAIGDTIVMSLNTPTHLRAKGLLPNATDTKYTDKEDINRQLNVALGKVAFLPYAYLVDKYRWKIFRGEINNTNYNSKWWQMREQIQGITSPVSRTEEDFDPGAKFHISANIPYIRYFLSRFLQYQFYEALCRKSGHRGAIHKCDFYNSKEAGHLLRSMMAYGSSEPWPKLLSMVTGSSSIRSQPLLNYFKPLYTWLRRTNKQHNMYFLVFLFHAQLNSVKFTLKEP